MNNGYWLLEYAKVFLAYMFVMFIYPSVVFRSYLKGKGKVFWFGFCVCSMIVLQSTVVLILGLVGLLNVWVVRLLFYGPLLWSVIRMIHLPMTPRYFVYKVSNQTYGWKLFFLHLRTSISKSVHRALCAGWNWVKRDFIEVIALVILLVYGLIYFSYNSLTEHYYGFGDMYVHNSWIYGLMQGQSFSGNVYPEAMHCMVYLFYAVFDIRVYTVLLFMQCVHIVTFLMSAYFLIREIFPWKYTGLIVLTAFLTLKLECINEVYAMSRLQWTIPQEYGLFTVFLIPTFLVRYLKKAGCICFKGKKTKMYWNHDLVVFLLSIAASFAVHFYTTIMAVLACLGVAVIWIGKLINWKRLVPLAATAILAILVAAMPMVLALLQGIPFQGSIFWALNVMNGVDDVSTSAQEIYDRTMAEREKQKELEEQTAIEQGNSAAGGVQQGINVMQGEKLSVGDRAISYLKKVPDMLKKFYNVLKKAPNVLLSDGYKTLYREKWGALFAIFTVLPFLGWVVYRFLAWALKYIIGWKNVKLELFDGYAIQAMIAFIFMLIYAGGRLGIPSIIAESRLCAVEHMFLLTLLAIPVDLIGTILSVFCGTWVMQSTGLLGVAAVFFAVIHSGNYHGYLYFEGSRYTAAVEVTNSIISSFPEKQYTILSTTDELYQVIEYGFHEEYLTMLQNYKQQEYYIPTKYLFFYVEKHPLQYGQSHFASGPDWLALERYDSLYGESASLCPEVLHGEISDDKADRVISTGTKLSDGYTILENRETVESAVARYMRILLSQYPNESSVYYEDDDFICYFLEQNPDRLINLHYLASEVVP